MTTTLDCTKPDYYRTRDGRIAQVVAYNPAAEGYHRVVGWIGSYSESWGDCGCLYECAEYRDDLVEYIGPELPKSKKKVKLTPAVMLSVAGTYMLSEQMFASEQEAQDYFGSSFVSWQEGVPFSVEVEAKE